MVEWAEGRSVPIEIEGSGPSVVLAHGAGAGSVHPFMQGVRSGLLSRGFRVVTFDYPYVAEGRRAPDRLNRLVECHTAVWQAAGDGDKPFLAGKSMGGRVGSHLEVPAPGLVFFGYPLVAPGKREVRDTAHLETGRPMLFIQGTRDALAPLDLVTQLVEGLSHATLEIMEDGDHSFRLPKARNEPPEAVFDRLAEIAAAWMLSQLEGGV
jgi:predicted alpha/beta-hydrolase family hydrolase